MRNGDSGDRVAVFFRADEGLLLKYRRIQVFPSMSGRPLVRKGFLSWRVKSLLPLPCSNMDSETNEQAAAVEIIVETFRAHRETSSSSVRVRPLPGQGFSTTLRVECSKSMRQQYPVG